MRQFDQPSGCGPVQNRPGIVSELRDQHAWLHKLVGCAVATHSPRRRAELAQSIRYHWESHADAEEKCVYWLLERHVQTADWVHAGRSEHAHIDRLVASLVRLDARGTQWRSAAVELAAALEDHTHTEEMGVLSRMPVLLERDERRSLGELYSQLRTEGGPAFLRAVRGPQPEHA